MFVRFCLVGKGTNRGTAHSGTQHAQTLVTALFNQTTEDKLRKDFSYDFYDGQGVRSPSPPPSPSIPVYLTSSDMVYQPKVANDPFASLVRSKLSKIFIRKGAALMDSPLLMPYSTVFGTRTPFRLLDNEGTVVCLPFQLNIPFCRMVARDASLTRLKRWTIAPIYRISPSGGVGHFSLLFLPIQS